MGYMQLQKCEISKLKTLFVGANNLLLLPLLTACQAKEVVCYRRKI